MGGKLYGAAILSNISTIRPALHIYLGKDGRLGKAEQKRNLKVLVERLSHPLQ